jgi:Ca-activated chloride channel family protein
MPGEIDLKVALHRQAYQTSPFLQQAYVLLDAMPTAAAPGVGTQPLNFSLVLDRSGSMAGEKLRQLKEAAKLVVDRLTPQDFLSIVIFDEIADVVIPASPVADSAVFKQKIDAIQERGGTKMSTGMQVGFAELQRASTPDRVSRMLLLTDGRTWEDPPDCLQLAEQHRDAGIPISVLGFSEGDWDPAFLEDLAQRSGGDWVAIEAPEEVAGVFEDALTEMKGTAVTNASLTMRLVEGVQPRTVWRVTPLISRLGHREIGEKDVQVFLGDIQHGVGQSVLADVLIPPRQAGNYRMIHADITYDVPGSGLTGQREEVNVVVTYTDDVTEANNLDPRLMNIIERVVAHKLQTQALDEAALGDVKVATQRLRAAATRLLDLGELEMAEEAQSQAENLEESGQVDQAAAQQMRYKTKKLTEIKDEELS